MSAIRYSRHDVNVKSGIFEGKMSVRVGNDDGGRKNLLYYKIL